MKRSELRPPKVILNPRHEAEESVRLARLDLLESGLPAILLSIHAKKFDDQPFQAMLDRFGEGTQNGYGRTWLEVADGYWRHVKWLWNHEDLAWQKQEKDRQTILDAREQNPAFNAVLTAAEESGKLAASDNAKGSDSNSGNLEDDKAPGFVLDSARLSVADIGNPLAASDTL